MNDFVFDLQRFATTEIKKDNSTTIDGVTYTAVEDAVLNLDSNNKVSGIASGSVTATLEGNSAVQVTFDGNKAFDFSCSADDDALAVTMQGKSIRFTAGAINCSAEGVSASGEVSLKGFIAKVFPFNLKLDIPDAGLNITFDGETKITAPEKVNVTLTFPESIAKAIAQFSFVFTLLGVDTQTAQRIYNVLRKLVSSPTTAGLEGTFSWNQDDKKLTINQDSNLALNIIDYDLNMAAKNGSVDGMSFFAKFTQELGAFGAKFTPGTDENAVLNLKLDKNGSQILEGALNITAGSINIDIFNGNITFEKDTTFTLMQDNNEELNFKFSDGATITYSADEEGILYLSFDGNSGTMDLTKIKRTEYYTTSALVNLGVNGTLKVDTENETIIVTKDTTTTIYFGGYAYTVKAVGDAEINITLKNDNFIFTTKDGTGTLGLNVKRANETTFDGNLEINGSIEIDPISHKLNLSKDSSISLTHPNNINARTFLLTAANDDSFDLTIKAVDDAGLSSSIEQNGTTWTTATDGNLFTITIKRGGQTLLDGYLKIKGTFILDNNGDLILAKDTELQIDFGDDYIVNLKATEADSKIFIGNDEITFASDSEIGGGLELSVTRGDDSRSASLDVKGSVTYKLDGTISLTKGTEIKNVFEDGNILTITANTDTQDSIVFTPEDGLTIKPGSADTLTALFTVDNLNVIKVTSLEGSINYKEGLITAADGTKISMTNYESKGTIWTVEGGTLTVAYDDERAVYTVSKGTSVLVDWSYGKTWEFQSGSITDIYDGTEILSAGASFKGNDDTKKFTLEKAGKYTINGIDITTSSDNVEVRLPDYDTVSIGAKEGITVSATEDKAFRFKFGLSGTINVTTTGGGDFGISNGSVTFDEGKISIDKGTTVSLTAGEQVSAFTTNEDISAPYKIEEDIYYLTLDKASAGVCVTQDEQTVLAGKMEIDGVFSYRPETGTYGLTGAKNTSLQFTDENGLGIKMATNDTTIVFVPKYSDGKFEVNFPNENKNAMAFTVSKDGQTTFENNVVINGTVGFDTANQELSLTKETVLTLTQGENVMTITATDDAGGKLTAVEGGLRFAPNENDGALELNFVSANRKANIDVTGAIDFGEGGKISLEAGTEVNFTWEDGTKLKLTSKGSTGSISLDEKGIKITSEDEKLSIDLTTATGDQTHLSGIEGTIYYNAGTVSFDDNSKITATTTLGGESILMTLETQGGTGHLDFAKNGVIYSADSGAMKITWSKDDLESTFTVLSGSVQIGHGLFQIAEGTELSTDLKNFVPALYFTTQKAGSYTINGQKIETTAENIPMTATDDYMTFKTSDDVVKYDGMTFAGEGNVSLTSGGVVLGAGVEASGFEKDKSFILAQEGTVTADERIFELTEDVPTGISVKGAQDGFIFSRTITEESEARFENPNSEDIGKIFTEEFFLENDDAYRIQTDLLGLQKIIGVTAPSTLNATATFDGEPEETLFDLVTDNEGVFTVGKKDYSISGDSSVAIKADFEPDKSYVRGFDDLSGTVSGDFTSHVVSINGSSSAVQPVDDTLISIAADENGFEIFGLDKDASLKVAAKDSYKVNETSINTNAQDFIVGNGSNSAYLLAMNNNTIVTGTEGNDTIQNTGSNVTINAAQGNDQISLTSDARNNVIQYESGSGNDTIYGYNVMDLDFEDGESIVLTEAGAVTVEGKVFELTKKVPDGVTITGTQDGFTSSVTEDGKIFAEEFIAQGDDSYNVSIDGKGLQTISGIDAGTEVTTNATKDGEESENQIYIVTEDAGSYTFNDINFTASKANAVIRLSPEAMAFDASDGIIYDGKTFGGEGNVTVSAATFAIGAGVEATSLDKGESFILAQKGLATVNGRVFELTENISDGMMIEGADNGYNTNVLIDGKILSENVTVTGDENYSVQVSPEGLKKLSGISDGSTINANGTYGGQAIEQYFYLDTDTEGNFTIGEKVYNVSGDSSVEIEASFNPDESFASGFNKLDGTVSGDFASEAFYVNGTKPILIHGDDSIKVVGSSSGTKLYDISDGASIEYAGGVKEVHTDTEGTFTFGEDDNTVAVTVQGDDNVKFELNSAEYIENIADVEGDLIFSETSNSLFINGMGGTFEGEFSSIGAYDNSLYIHDIKGGTITAYEPDKVWLQMLGETMTLNGNRLTLTEDEDGIWLRDKEIVGLDDGASLQVSKNGTYTANETSLKAKAGDVIVGLENDAYIYDANNPLITRKTSNAEIIDHFKPNQTEIITSSKNLTLEGGDLAIVENTSAQVNITAGDDTIVSQGENVRVTLTPEKNTWLFPIDGKMTLEGYDASTGSGFGTTYKNILSEIEKGNVDFNNGILKLGSAQVDMSKSSELMNFFNRYSRQEKVGFASTNDSLDVSNETDDLLLVAKKNSTVKSGNGDDTILANEGSFVDGGAGKNLVKSNGATVALNGRTTVEGEVDTIYIAGADPAVDFKTNGLTFYDNNARKYLTFDGVHSTKKLNLYYADSNTLGEHVFIADDDWYNVSDGAADYYVGATASKNHGIDFSDVTTDLNIIMNTDYRSTTAEFWVNNIHSIKGGAGHDKMFGNTSADKNVATFFYMAGDGRDSISNFDFTNDALDVTADKVQLDDGSAITDVFLRGDDVGIRIDGSKEFLMLEGAQGKSFRVNDDLIAKVDKNVAFDGFTNCYIGIGTKATLTVGKGLGDVEVWLSDDSLEYHGTMYDGGFAVLDASQADGSNILAGNELNNSIIGGTGSNSLWGGYSSESDTLVGGAGQNTFFYGAGNGRDKIQNAHAGDEIILDDITLDQIAEANITAGGVILNFTDGGSLTIDGTADVTYQLADGSRYSADHATHDWVQK